MIFPYGSERHPGVQVQETIIKSGSKVAEHYHKKQTEFIYMLDGRLTLFFDGEAVTCRDGDLIIIEPGDRHAAENKGDDDARLLTFKVDGALDDSVWVK